MQLMAYHLKKYYWPSMRQLSSDITSHVGAQLEYCNFACRNVATTLLKS